MKKILNKVTQKENIKLLLLWLIIVVTVVPICLASAYSFFYADDFSEGVISNTRQNQYLFMYQWAKERDIFPLWIGKRYITTKRERLASTIFGKYVLNCQLA